MTEPKGVNPPPHPLEPAPSASHCKAPAPGSIVVGGPSAPRGQSAGQEEIEEKVCFSPLPKSTLILFQERLGSQRGRR